MKHLFFFLIAITLISCAAPPQKERIKTKPEFSTSISDPEVEVISKAYFDLSTRYNLKFDRKVSLGFSNIERKNVIGLCTFGNNFREIDLDREWWKKASWPSKVSLVYHEMTHCYCGREHDFDAGTMYPDGSLRFILDRFFNALPTPIKTEGYLDDGCPKSIMHPVIVDNSCFEKHYKYYAEEMFNRCKPWK